jgi:hypothetical protein
MEDGATRIARPARRRLGDGRGPARVRRTAGGASARSPVAGGEARPRRVPSNARSTRDENNRPKAMEITSKMVRDLRDATGAG